jgi:ABC-type glycerol-3-phosphate transport system permease component
LGESQPIANTPIAMSQQLTLCLIAITTNLAVMLVIYSFLALLLTRLAWQGGGVFAVIMTTVVAQLFWIAPALFIVNARDADSSASYALWFGNWLVCGFAVVLLWQTVRGVPRSLEDSARLDGLGLFGTWRHIIFPFVRRDLGLIAIFTIMATLLPFWAFINLPDASNIIVLYQRASSPGEHLGMMAAGSLIGALPLIAIFFYARGRPSSLQMSPEKQRNVRRPLPGVSAMWVVVSPSFAALHSAL